jgi:hypothetical protein
MSLQRKKPMTRSGFKPAVFGAVRATGKPRAKSLKSKQRAVTDQEKALWDRLAGLGCIACMLDGQFNPHVSIHHVDGRTKPDCHKKVLPLCAPHHQQDDTDPAGRVAVHPNKARFEKEYGTEYELLEYTKELLKGRI